MSLAAPPLPAEPSAAAAADRYRCGTLTYTQASLFTLFSWMLWGDFCFSLMENIWPSILPLMLKREGASNMTLSLVVTVLPSAMNFILNPIISTASDRHRGKRGRRVPFLLVATPFITVFLIMMGFSREIGTFLHGAIGAVAPNASPAAFIVATIAIAVTAFRFFELFVNTVFWYLFNDVVPVAFMGRFLGMFRVVGSLAGACFHFFLFKYAESHTSQIFFGVALLYGTMFFLMALNIKEGKYPPPEPMATGRGGVLAYVRTFFRECFRHRIYRLVFTYNVFFYAANVINTFTIFLAISIGLTLDDVGKIAGTAAVISTILMYPMGALVDRLNPIRMMLIAQAGCVLAFSTKLIFLFHDFPKELAFWIYAAAVGVAIPMTVANTVATLPMQMRVFPRSRFGQFCSANAMCGAVGTIVGGMMASGLLDVLRKVTQTENSYYRFIPIWNVVFILLAAIMTLLILREWRRLGGESSYKAPE